MTKRSQIIFPIVLLMGITISSNAYAGDFKTVQSVSETPAAIHKGKAVYEPKTLRNSYSIQVGAFLQRENADRMISNLRAKGYEPYIFKTFSANKQPLYILRIGDYNNLRQASFAATQFKKLEKISAIITKYDSTTPIPYKALALNEEGVASSGIISSNELGRIDGRAGKLIDADELAKIDGQSGTVVPEDELANIDAQTGTVIAADELATVDAPHRAKQILKEWKSLQRLREASREELEASAALTRPLAATIWQFFHGTEDQRLAPEIEDEQYLDEIDEAPVEEQIKPGLAEEIEPEIIDEQPLAGESHT
ncbi:MAG: SPOR domain-containing protein [Desulfobacterales bacterium]